MDESVRILVVDDEAMIIVMIEDALRDAGYEVEVAHSGEEALSIIEQATELAGIVTDIQTGTGADGWEIGRQARRRSPVVAVVYMSGASAGEYAAEGVPGSVMIQKPFAPDQIVTGISTQLNKIASAPE
ncbi:MAG: response regulator [Sphingosinicella sp.]|uniref:response regulator n=1 Tax=Sphingosinicella sp. TaxID=1917971 RepID=UPI0040380023